MNSGTVAAICVSVFGFITVVAAVWLFYQYRLAKISLQHHTESEPPVRRLIIHRGLVVPASKLPTPSIRSGWSSVKHRSWLLSTPSSHRTEDDSIDTPPLPPHPPMAQYSAKDLEAGLWRKGSSLPDIKTVMALHTDAQGPPHRDLTSIPVPPSRARLPKPKTSAPPARASSNRHAILESSEEKRSAEGTFYDDACSETIPNFPRPPYLSPLLSRYHVQRTSRYDST